MSSFKPPDKFVPGPSPAEAWSTWRQNFELYAIATDLSSKPAAQQRAILLLSIGEDNLNLYNILPIPEPEQERTVLIILNAFSAYFAPHKNTTLKRYLFLTSTQAATQTIDMFVADLRIKARDCELGVIADSLIRDILIIGLRDHTLRERLLRESSLTLDSAVNMCRADESSRQQSAVMSGAADAPVYALSKSAGLGQQTTTRFAPAGGQRRRHQLSAPGAPERFQAGTGTERKKCEWCGGVHPPRKCPAFGVTCHNCGKVNHFASVCRSRSIHAISAEESQECEFIGSLTLDELQSPSNSRMEWTQALNVAGLIINFKIDTGSQVNIIPKTDFDQLSFRPFLQQTKQIVKSYSGNILPILGVCELQCSLANQPSTYRFKFFVLDDSAPPILGLTDSTNLGLVQRTYDAHATSMTPLTTQDIFQEFSDVFEGLGSLPGKHSITLCEGAVPQVCAARKVPYALRDKVKAELDRMVQLGVITSVDEPTDWVHPMVCVSKPNGDIRICLDPHALNEAIKREYIQLPTTETLLADLKHWTTFTVLDVTNAFWHVVLDEASSKLCTFATPFGRFRFLRLPYGIKSAPEVFHKALAMALPNQDDVLQYFDDILTGGINTTDHNNRLRTVLSKAREANIKFCRRKLQLAQPRVKFVGHWISAGGVEPDPDKITAIVALKQPTNKKELQRVLGMVNYLTRFLPNLATKTQYLRQLLSSKNEWTWDSQADHDFEEIKKLVASATKLAHFDPNKQSVLAVDASSYGLGATLLQDNLPVSFASASLSATQKQYAPIEKELLAVVFAAEHFHYYIYGTNVTVQTDHKPLLGLIKKPLNTASPRLQKLLLRLQRYQVQLQYIPGSEMYVPDTLSRDPQPNASVDTTDIDDPHLCVHSLLAVSDSRLNMLQQATQNDPALSQVRIYIESGWPAHKSALHPDASLFWQFRNELGIRDNLIFRNARVVIPLALRSDILDDLHSGHQGIVACKTTARESVFWPGITTDIEKKIETCSICQLYARANRTEPLRQHPIPERPWTVVGTDLLKIKDKSYILVVDYFSRYVEIQLLPANTTAEPVILALKSIFARHGIPMTLISDNGPPFSSASFRAFLTSWDIHHVTSSPQHPQCNGQAERAVQTVKGILLKAMASNTDPYLALLRYRATPSLEGASPALMLMGRNLRTTVPVTTEHLHPTFDTQNIYTRREQYREYQKQYADRHSAQLSPLRTNQPVYLSTGHRQWVPATVTTCRSEPRSYDVTTTHGAVYRRNRAMLRPRREVTPPTINTTTPENSPDNHTLTSSSNPDNHTLKSSPDVTSHQDHSTPYTPTRPQQSTRVYTRRGRPVIAPRRLNL